MVMSDERQAAEGVATCPADCVDGMIKAFVDALALALAGLALALVGTYGVIAQIVTRHWLGR
jgi:hypothetical protein